MLSRFHGLALVSWLALAGVAQADPNDWVQIEYVLQQAHNPSFKTSDSRQTIMSRARQYSQKGPWSVTNAKGVLPPSNDPHDYLSWAPYHWPDCNWCSNGRTHLSHTGNDTSSSNSTDTPEAGVPPPPGGDITGPPAEDLDGNQNYLEERRELKYHQNRMNRVRRDLGVSLDLPASESTTLATGDLLPSSTIPSDATLPTTTADPALAGDPQAIFTATSSLPTTTMDPLATSASSSEETPTGTASFSDMPQAAAHTSAKPKCTPSPTKSLAPSATWTTCPYVVRDGKVNPDVRTLNGVSAINAISETSIYLGITAILQSGSDSASKLVSFVNTFFLDPKTRMNPNMNFGQIVRGPGPSGREGTFTGVLDLRGMVKIVNACMILRAANHPAYTPAFDKAFVGWVKDYTNWLQTSEIGHKTATRPNNHASFFVSQLTSLLLFQGDTAGAKKVLDGFFHGAFKDQIAKSGEQPFESVRTRPFHYRAFNLEALITNAKLGAQLGVDYYNFPSKYGRTIQDAVNFAMNVKPGKEDVEELLPHVAAVAAAYGDPRGVYARWIAAHDGQGGLQAEKAPYWFYDQAGAVGVRKARREVVVGRGEELAVGAGEGDAEKSLRDGKMKRDGAMDVPFECPQVFALLQETEVEVDDGLYVTCETLQPYYELPELQVPE
ncbi:alginate lyase-domain-containing protein [Schizophyllum commune]